MLSRETLLRLNKNELIALCVYFDKEWRTQIVDFNTNNAWLSSNVISKQRLIDILLDVNTTEIPAIQKIVHSQKLTKFSFVRYGEFTLKNKECANLCKNLKIKINKRTFEYLYDIWIKNEYITYYQLAANLNYLYSSSLNGRNRALFKLSEFVSYLD